MPSWCCSFTTSRQRDAECARARCAPDRASRCGNPAGRRACRRKCCGVMSTRAARRLAGAIVSRVGSNGSCTVVSSFTSAPTTSGWPLPMNTLTVPPSCFTTFTEIFSRQLVEQAVALIEQVVRRLPAGAGDARRDLVVQPRDALRDRVDLGHFALDARIDLVADLVQARVEALQALLQGIGLAQQDLARGNRGRRVRDALERVDELLQRRGQAVRRIAEQVVEALGIGSVDVEVLEAAGGRARLRGDEVVVDALRGLDFDALPDPAVAVGLRRTRADQRRAGGCSRRC